MNAKPIIQLRDDIARADPFKSTGVWTSEPIPVRVEGRVLVAAFHYEAGYDANQRTNFIAPPIRVTYVDPSTGAVVRSEPRPGGATLGSEKYVVPREEVASLSDELYRAYDVLLPAFSRLDAKPSAEVVTAAKTYKRAFERLVLKLLVPSYRETGREWFTWIDALAAS